MLYLVLDTDELETSEKMEKSVEFMTREARLKLLEMLSQEKEEVSIGVVKKLKDYHIVEDLVLFYLTPDGRNNGRKEGKIEEDSQWG